MILSIVLDYDSFVVQGHTIDSALQKLRATQNRYDLKIVNALESLTGASAGAQEACEIAVGNIKPGMVFIDDLYTHVGTLLVPKGFEVTEAFLQRAQNFGPGILQEKVRVIAPVRKAPKLSGAIEAASTGESSLRRDHA
jgi:hypothetical protein